MPKSSGSSGKGYDVTSSGTNSQVSSPSSLPQDTCQPQVLGKGNHYDSRDYTSSTGGNQANHNTYHYSNHDGSYYYSNANGSTYHNDGNGGSNYTAPGKK
ncbi:hypothetical protein IMSHALPRED_005777 [Imshaugia aleurites]|uniref:Uncharacterized protein n=1 Tax=Imshaugia aleurites TaxID=172621 RepID=A0A8H3IJ71_9LECA|nr:hypothetical protein IMSHALPRED_005777 [Imshaugia aleurites]